MNCKYVLNMDMHFFHSIQIDRESINHFRLDASCGPPSWQDFSRYFLPGIHDIDTRIDGGRVGCGGGDDGGGDGGCRGEVHDCVLFCLVTKASDRTTVLIMIVLVASIMFVYYLWDMGEEN